MTTMQEQRTSDPESLSFHIRLGRVSEIATLRQVERRASERFRDYPHLIPGQAVTPASVLHRAAAASLLWVAEGRSETADDTEVIGFIAAEPLGEDLHIVEVDVLPTWGQRGVGSALLRRVIEAARQGGYPGVTLTTFEKVPWNAPFYARRGFHALDETQWSSALRARVEAEDDEGFRAVDRLAMRYDLASEDSMEVSADLPAEQALPRLLEQHGPQLYRLSLKLCGHPQDAEDLVQEIFLIAWRKWHQFQGQSRATTWLYRIAARACMRRRRRRSGEPSHLESLSELLPRADATVPDLQTFDSPLDSQLRRESREAVERAIASLPIHFRMPLVLKEIVELPLSDIAAILDLKEATVKTRVHRGRLLLRRALAEVLPQQEAPPPDHPRQMCLDLLHAKQESLDRGVPFAVPQEELCTRCRSLFATLDLGHGICESLRRGETLPPKLRQALNAAFVKHCPPD